MKIKAIHWRRRRRRIVYVNSFPLNSDCMLFLSLPMQLLYLLSPSLCLFQLSTKLPRNGCTINSSIHPAGQGVLQRIARWVDITVCSAYFQVPWAAAETICKLMQYKSTRMHILMTWSASLSVCMSVCLSAFGDYVNGTTSAKLVEIKSPCAMLMRGASTDDDILSSTSCSLAQL